MIDTHTHLYLDDFDSDRDKAVQRALDAGVRKLLLPAIDSQSTDRLLQMAARYPNVCHPMAGLHPTSVTHDYHRELHHVELQLQHPQAAYIAVGEIGLDLYWDKTYLSQQIDALRQQLLLASRHRLPVVLHLRSAKQPATTDDDAYHLFFQLWQSLPPHQRPIGVMHCYSGTVAQALRAVECGFLIGVGGVVTYKNSLLQQVVSALPLETLLLETDSPYLAPVPHRGHRNESAYIPDILDKIAQLKSLPQQTIATQTTQNAQHLFHLPS